jgi:hypothetical protein
MTTKIEEQAKLYLINEFQHDNYQFIDKEVGEKGFDFWLFNKSNNAKSKIELKAHSGTYTRPSSLFERLIFNAKIEKELFERGETSIARVFLGEKPYKVFIITKEILNNGAVLAPEARYTIKGRINYNESYTEIS